MIVRNRMSKRVVVVDPERSLDEVRALLARHKIRQLPVVHSGRLIGIVTDRDLRRAPVRAQTVRAIMTAKPLVVEPDTPVDEAAHRMRARKINALPVVDQQRIVGIISVSDVLDAFVDLSGVKEPSYLLVVTAGKAALSELRATLGRCRAEVKWLRPNRGRASEVHVRLKTRRVDEVVDVLESAGFDVDAVVASRGSR